MYSYEILHIHRPASNSRYLDHLESIEPYFCMFDVPKHHVDCRNLNLISPWVELLSFLKIPKKMIDHSPITTHLAFQSAGVWRSFVGTVNQLEVVLLQVSLKKIRIISAELLRVRIYII